MLNVELIYGNFLTLLPNRVNNQLFIIARRLQSYKNFTNTEFATPRMISYISALSFSKKH